MVVRIPREDFIGYGAKFASRRGEVWLILGLILSNFCKQLFKEHIKERYMPEITGYAHVLYRIAV